MPRSHESNHSEPVLLEVERVREIDTGRERVVLRVDGRYGDRPGKRVLDAMLFVDDGLAVHRHAPVPDAADPGDGWLWRAAFEVPESYLTDARTRFALESDPGSLIDLPRPGELLASPAVPVTARAAQLARRYAAAVAVVLTVAVAPGVLPSQARTQVLRVHHADGTVGYVNSDGQALGQAPGEAVVADQPAPAPEPAPEPVPAPQDAQPLPEEPPAATPDGKKPDQHPQMDAGRGLSNLAQRTRDQAAGSGVGVERTRPGQAASIDKKRHHGGKPNAGSGHAAATPGAGRTGGRPVQHQAHSAPPHTQRHDQQPSATGSDAQPAAVATHAEPLQTIPLLVAGTDSTLQPLDEMGGSGQAENFTPAADLPSNGLQPLDSLGGGAASAAGDAKNAGPPANMAHTPPLIPPGQTPAPTPSPTPSPTPDRTPTTHHGTPQPSSGSDRPAKPPKEAPVPPRPSSGGGHSVKTPVVPGVPSTGGSGAATTSSSPFGTLPGPGQVTGVPNFVIQQFRVPPFLLSIYQAAGIQYGIRWEVLAAINEIETDYGRNLNVSSAGALGWMQFMPSTWQMYGTDANKDGKSDPYNPVDAIFAAARYLKAAGGDTDLRRAIFAYNHAGWYVDSVMLRARLIAGYPADMIGSLTGLTEGRFPVAARARYADSLNGAAALKRVQPGQNAANVVDSSATRRGIDIYAREGAPVVAVNDGVVQAIGRSKDQGLYVELQDVYGNRYTYSGLASLTKLYPVPNTDVKAASKSDFQPVGASDPKPNAPASAGTQRPGAPPPKQRQRAGRGHKAVIAAVKQRLFAHPGRRMAKSHGGADQLLTQPATGGFETYDNYFSHGLGLNSRNATLKPLKKGSHVIGSTVLGRVGGGKDPHVRFEIRPAGKGAPSIDPKPILDGWKLLESSAVYRAKGKNVLYGDGSYSIGEVMLLPKPLLIKRVLSDPRINIYPGGRDDIRTGQIDRRVLIVLEYLAESGLKPTVSCLKSGHSEFTSSGNVSEHSSGNAVDIAAINGLSINGNQGAGSVTETAIKRLMLLQGTLRPHQIISLLDFGQNTMAMSDHADHIHVGFQPLFGANEKLGRETQSVLKPGQWDTLVQRLGQIENPTVPTRPSRYAIPSRGQGGR